MTGCPCPGARCGRVPRHGEQQYYLVVSNSNLRGNEKNYKRGKIFFDYAFFFKAMSKDRMTVAHNKVYSSGLYLFFQPDYMYGLACLFEMCTVPSACSRKQWFGEMGHSMAFTV